MRLSPVCCTKSRLNKKQLQLSLVYEITVDRLGDGWLVAENSVNSRTASRHGTENSAGVVQVSFKFAYFRVPVGDVFSNR